MALKVTPWPEGWPVRSFMGSYDALKWNRRDLPQLDAIVALTRGRTAVIQAGGNLGVFPKRLAASFQTVYTFEPAADLFEILMHNAPEPNIVKFQAAVGDERTLVGLSRIRRDGKPDNHEGITHVSGPGTIPTLRIDDLQLPVCDLVQLDTEGWEFFALRGAVDTLARCRPLLAVEINKGIEFVGFTRETVRAFIQAQGYRHVVTLQSDEVFEPVEWH